MASATTLFVRNARPNRVIVRYDNLRNVVERRGTREDTLSLPIDAKNDPVIARWLKQGVLEQITQEQFTKLAARQIDVEPGQFLKRPIRNGKSADLLMHPAESDTTRSPSSIREVDVRKSAVPRLEWNGELMSTAEELEEMDFSAPENNYPSKNRDDNNNDAYRRASGY